MLTSGRFSIRSHKTSAVSSEIMKKSIHKQSSDGKDVL